MRQREVLPLSLEGVKGMRFSLRLLYRFLFGIVLAECSSARPVEHSQYPRWPATTPEERAEAEQAVRRMEVK